MLFRGNDNSLEHDNMVEGGMINTGQKAYDALSKVAEGQDDAMSDLILGLAKEVKRQVNGVQNDDEWAEFCSFQ